jgi:hypothetical protein
MRADLNAEGYTGEPVMIQALRITHTSCGLWLIYDATGQVLEAVETSDGTRPPAWRSGMGQLPTIDVMPSVWRHWRDRYPSTAVTAEKR